MECVFRGGEVFLYGGGIEEEWHHVDHALDEFGDGTFADGIVTCDVGAVFGLDFAGALPCHFADDESVEVCAYDVDDEFFVEFFGLLIDEHVECFDDLIDVGWVVLFDLACDAKVESFEEFGVYFLFEADELFLEFPFVFFIALSAWADHSERELCDL